MLNLRNTSILLAVVVGVIYTAGSFAVSPTAKTPGSQNNAPQSVFNIGGTNALPSSLLAARYHLRKRTSRFFQRATGSKQNAARKGVSRRHGTVKRSGTEGTQDLHLAATYHLRKRTAHFFGRTVG